MGVGDAGRSSAVGRVDATLPGGQRISRSREGWRRVVTVQKLYLEVLEANTLGVHADPDDASVTWVRSRDRCRLFGLFALDIDAVSRHRLDVHGLITESQVYPGL